MAILYIVDGWDLTSWRDAMRLQAPEQSLRFWPDHGDPQDINYALVWKPPHGVFNRFPNLKGIFCLGAGVDTLMTDPDLPDLPIGRIVDANLTQRMTEYVVFHVLLHHRQHLMLTRAQHKRTWVSIDQPAAADVRVGIMGLGALGSDAAEKLRLMGFKVAGWSRTPKQIAGIECFSGAGQFTAFLNRTDILVCLLPHTPDTTGLLDAQVFRSLARDGALPGPVLINAGRGKIQVEMDILRALDNGDLHGASLDVFEREPLEPESPLWVHPRVVVTPHIAADSDHASITRNILAQISRLESGRPLANQVNLAQGY